MASLFVDSYSPRKDLLFPHGPNLAQKPLYLVGTVFPLAIMLFLTFVSDMKTIMCTEGRLVPSRYLIYWIVSKRKRSGSSGVSGELWEETEKYGVAIFL